MAWRWQLLLARARRRRARAVADAGVLRLLRGRPGAADVGRRRRVAHLRDGAPPPGQIDADHRLGAARARARRRRHARARGGRLPARDRALPDRRRTSGSRCSSSSRPIAAGVRLLLPHDPQPARASRCRSSRRLRARDAGARGLRRAARLPRPPRDAAQGRARSRPPRSSRASSRSTRRAAPSASTSRCCPYVVLGPLLFLVMLVPFTVNGLGVREAFFVSFLGKLGVGARPGVRVRLPVLPDDDPARAARARVILWENVFGRRAPVADGTA